MFSWETAWPQRNTMGSGDISRDIVINDGAISHGKSYMIRKFCLSGAIGLPNV